MSRKIKTKIEFEIGSSNIFADLGLNEPDELYTRAALGVQVMKILKERSYSQKQAAEFLGIKQPEISAIMCAKFRRFSQERLIGFLNKLNQKVTIEVSRDRKGEPYQRVTFAA
jgi:predicted XRE-type DNA-binding protein